ncbi:hypothetical protein L4D00_24740, partial [Photobacterium swingsii]
LKDQWAGLFADFLSSKSKERELTDLSTQVSSLKELSSVLKGYSESIMEKLEPENFQQIIESSNSNLRKRYISIFEKHDMINYLIDRTPKGVGVSKLYDAFESSSNITEFLRKASFENEFIKYMDETPRAHEDFDSLKRELG